MYCFFWRTEKNPSVLRQAFQHSCFHLLLLGGAVLVLSSGCRKEVVETAKVLAPPTNAVARVAGSFVSLEELINEAGGRHRLRSQEAAQRALDELIQHRAILARAQLEHFDEEPEVRRAINELIISAYRERHLLTNAAIVTDEQIEAYYTANLKEFTRPRAIRIGVLKLDPNAGNFQETLDAAAAADEIGFKQLAAKHSLDQATRYRGGDAGWIEESDAHPRWPQEVMKAAWHMEDIGLISAPIDLGDSLYVIRMNSFQGARTNSLQSVADVIRHRLTKQQLAEARDKFYEELIKTSDVEIYDGPLNRLIEKRGLPQISPPSTPGQ